MKWLFYVLILICVLSGTVSEICPIEACIAVCVYVVLGIFFEIRGIQKKSINRILGILLFAGLIALDVMKGEGFQAVILGACLDIVWALLGYRALTHEHTSERIQVAILAILPLSCVAFSLQAIEYIAFLVVYFFVLFAYLTAQSLTAPTTGSIAYVEHPVRQFALHGGRFWLKTVRLIAIAFGIGALLFLVIPRYGADSHASVPGVEQPTGSFPDVELDKTGTIELDKTLMFRADVPENSEGYYWRIDVQNVFDGTRWRSFSRQQQSDAPAFSVNMFRPAYHLHFIREWRDYRIPTLTGTVEVVKLEDDNNDKLTFYEDGTGGWKRFGWKRGAPLMGFLFRLEDSESRDSLLTSVKKMFADEKSDEDMRKFSTRFIWPSKRRNPEARNRLYEFVKKIVGNAQTDEEKAVLIRDYLKTHYKYSLNRPQRNGAIVEDFLFEQKFGHCEVFSTTMAVLLALEDIPVRNVTGFVSTEFRDGYNNVRAAHAHSWVEAWIDGEWKRYDPTPSGAQIVEVGWLLRMDDWFSSYQTQDFYNWLRENGLMILAILLGMTVFAFLMMLPVRYIRNRMRPTNEVYALAWHELMEKCQKNEKTRALAERSLESWWSDGCAENAKLQSFARDYIRFRYAEDEKKEESSGERFVMNCEILRRKSEIVRGWLSKQK